MHRLAVFQLYVQIRNGMHRSNSRGEALHLAGYYLREGIPRLFLAGAHIPAAHRRSIVSQMDTTFIGCPLLKYLRFSGSLKVDIWLSGAPLLTVESFLSVLKSIANLTEEEEPVTDNRWCEEQEETDHRPARLHHRQGQEARVIRTLR